MLFTWQINKFIKQYINYVFPRKSRIKKNLTLFIILQNLFEYLSERGEKHMHKKKIKLWKSRCQNV